MPDIRTVSMGPMCDLTITLRGNLFDLHPAGRALVGEITDAINRYEQAEYQARIAEAKARGESPDAK